MDKNNAAKDRLLGYANPAYDQAAKRILANKKIMAYILKGTVREFAAASIDDIADKYIEGDIIVSEVAVNPDKTNAKRKATKIRGIKNENGSPTEGWITFDILFEAISPLDGEPLKLIINVESQKTQQRKKIGYDLLKRAIYYGSRLISSQKEIEFVGSNYDDIKKVYTIWICMDAPQEQSAINRYAVREEPILGSYKAEPKSYDLITAVMVCLGNDRNKDRLIRLLQVLFKERQKSAQEKEQILSSEYAVDVTNDLAEEMRSMCNLSEGIYEEGLNSGIVLGMEKGIERGIEQGLVQGIERGLEQGKEQMIHSLAKEGLPLELIARVSGYSLAEVKRILGNN